MKTNQAAGYTFSSRSTALAAKPEWLNDGPVVDTLIDLILVAPSKLAMVMRYDLNNQADQQDIDPADIAA